MGLKIAEFDDVFELFLKFQKHACEKSEKSDEKMDF
jgi:hypothetical protein